MSAVKTILNLAGHFINLTRTDYNLVIKGCLNESVPVVKQKVPVLPSDLLPLEIYNIDVLSNDLVLTYFVLIVFSFFGWRASSICALTRHAVRAVGNANSTQLDTPFCLDVYEMVG